MISKSEYHSVITTVFSENIINVENVTVLAKYFFDLECFKANKVLSTKRFKALVHLVINQLNISDPLAS